MNALEISGKKKSFTIVFFSKKTWYCKAIANEKTATLLDTSYIKM